MNDRPNQLKTDIRRLFDAIETHLPDGIADLWDIREKLTDVFRMAAPEMLDGIETDDIMRMLQEVETCD